MADQNKDLPELESDGEGMDSADSPSKSRQPGDTTATPSNTPVVNLFSKAPGPSGATKRGFEGVGAPGSDANAVTDMLNKLKVEGAATKKAPAKGKADPEDEDEDDDEDDDDEEGGDNEDGGDDEDEEDEEEAYVATEEQRQVVVPLLKENQTKLDQIQEAYRKERRELEIKFQNIRLAHYKEREAIIRGTDEDSGPSLPGFWLDAFSRSFVMQQFVEEWDEPVLIFLENITEELLTGDEFGYSLNFHFAKNPFFSNEVLTKTIKLSNMYGADYSTPDIEESIGTEIKWFEDKNVTVEIIVKKIKAGKKGKKGSNQTKEIKQEVPRESFFNFFETRQELGEEEMNHLAEEELEMYNRGWEVDFAITSTIRSKIIPQAANWYTGEAEDSDAYEGEEDEEGEDEDDEDEDEDDDDEFDELEDEDDEDDEDDKPAKGGKKQQGKGKGAKPAQAGGAAPAAGAEGQPECKQQ